MKKFRLVFMLTLSFILGQLFLFNPKLSADVGYVPTPGGTITPGDKTDKIEMIREKVVFDVNEDDPAHVTAEFDMKNVTSADENMELIFPIPGVPMYESDVDSWSESFDPEANQHATNFLVKVEGKEVEFEYDVYKRNFYLYNIIEGRYDIGDESDEYVLSIKFPVTFRANAITQITVEYDTLPNNYGLSIYMVFEYILETGSHWKGNIGSGEIVFNFPDDLFEDFLFSYNEEFEFFENKLIWEFTDLEPDSRHNINVWYSPTLVGIWREREKYMENIFSSGKATYTIPFYQGYKHSLRPDLWGHPVYLLHSQPEQWEDPYNQLWEGWWIVELEDKRAPWVQFEFDAIYEVDAMRITSGILHEEDDTVLNLVSRPEEINLVFSDGSSKKFTLADSPCEQILLEFDKVETSSVKVEVLSTYPDYEEKDEYLGIERLNFNVGKKIGEKIVNLNLIFPEEFLGENSNTTRIDQMTMEELKSVANLTLEVMGKNKVVFADTLDLSKQVTLTQLQDFAEYVDFSQVGKVRIDTDYLDVFNAAATVTMYSLFFDGQPIIYKDGKVATSDEVSNAEYDKTSGILTFDVSAFSTYEARGKVVATGESPKKDSSLLVTLALIAFVTIAGIAVVLVYKRKEINLSALKRRLGIGSKQKEAVEREGVASGSSPEI